MRGTLIQACGWFVCGYAVANAASRLRIFRTSLLAPIIGLLTASNLE